MSERQTVAGAYRRLEDHERQCALNYRSLQDQGNATNGKLDGLAGELNAIKAGIRWVLRGLVMIMLSLIVWLASQLYGYIQRDIERNHAAAAAALAARQERAEGRQ